VRKARLGLREDGASMDSRTFYDEYVARQIGAGVNKRHRAILAWLRRFGLRADASVLEIGCGVGTVTQLLAGELRNGGSVLGVDVSPRSVEVARQRLAPFKNVRFEVGDVFELQFRSRFDVIVLPDVIEHIRLELHSGLFERLAAWISPTGFIFLHYPNPFYMEWCRVHQPAALQLVDEAVHADLLLARAYPHGLYLSFLETYSVWIPEGDYVAAVLRPLPAAPSFTACREKPPSVFAWIRQRLRRLVRRVRGTPSPGTLAAWQPEAAGHLEAPGGF
jgi:trans-aconitate 2-methyltransferase